MIKGRTNKTEEERRRPKERGEERRGEERQGEERHLIIPMVEQALGLIYQMRRLAVMANKILIIEDDQAIVRLMRIALRTNGYDSIVASNGVDGISMFLQDKPNLVLLDMGLPDIDGFEVLKQIRIVSETPVIIVSARDREVEKVKALDEGANDYVTKPFNIGELLARIRVAFRLVKPLLNEEVFKLDYLTVDFDKRRVTIDG